MKAKELADAALDDEVLRLRKAGNLVYEILEEINRQRRFDGQRPVRLERIERVLDSQPRRLRWRDIRPADGEESQGMLQRAR